jgi:BirA family biotin operon repressor/biotin-[acetyl-CoA-carboxylase] ligase
MKLPPLDIRESVTSTMDAARERIRSGHVLFDSSGHPSEGGVIAREQTAGRGQRGRNWYAEPGANLNATFYFGYPPTDPLHVNEISLLAGVAVMEALKPLAPSAFGLKWPNDILFHNRKLGGILIEMVKTPEGAWVALIGIGINLSTLQFPEELKGIATSLLREGIAPPDWRELGEQIRDTLNLCAEVRRDHGFDALLTRWRECDRTRGRRYETQVDGQSLTGVAEGIDAQGALLLRTSEGGICAVTSATSLSEMI